MIVTTSKSMPIQEFMQLMTSTIESWTKVQPPGN
jgi:hypothetical protein